MRRSLQPEAERILRERGWVESAVTEALDDLTEHDIPIDDEARPDQFSNWGQEFVASSHYPGFPPADFDDFKGQAREVLGPQDAVNDWTEDDLLRDAWELYYEQLLHEAWGLLSGLDDLES